MNSSSCNRYLPPDPSSFNPDEDDNTCGDGRVKNNLLEELYADFGDETDTLNFGNYCPYGLQDADLLPNPGVVQRVQPPYQTDPSLPYTSLFGQDILDANNINNQTVSQMTAISKPAYTISHQGSRSTGVTSPMLFSSESVVRQTLMAKSTPGRVRGCNDLMKLQPKEEAKMSTTMKFEQSECHSVVGGVGSTCSLLAEAEAEHISVGSKRRCPGHSESQVGCANNQSMRGSVLNNPVRNDRLTESSQPPEGTQFEDALRHASCSNSNASSPGLPASKRRRTINSGLDLFAEVTEAYGFVRGANIYAPTTHPTFASQDASRTVQPRPVYHFDYSKTINFNFLGADGRPRDTPNSSGANYLYAEDIALFPNHPENPSAIPRCPSTASVHRSSESTGSNYSYADGASCTFSKPQPMQGAQHYLNNAIYASQNNRRQSAASTASCAPRTWYSSPSEATGSPHQPVPSRVISKPDNANAAYVQDDSGIYNKNLQRNVLVGKARNPYENYVTGNPAMHFQQDTSQSYSVPYSHPDYSNMPNYSNTSSNAYCKVDSASNNYLVGHPHPVRNSSFLSNNTETAYGSSYSSCRQRPSSGANSYYSNATVYPLGLETIPEFLPDPSNPGENPTVNSDYRQTVRDPIGIWSTEPPAPHSRMNRPSGSCNVPLIQQSFMKNFFGEGSEPYQTHYLFSLLRDLIIADMNYNTSKFPFSLISNLPTDFDRLLQNYFAQNPELEHHRQHPQVDKLVMEALRHAHRTLLEKIRVHQGNVGQSAASRSDVMTRLCDNFQKKFPKTESDDDFSRLRSFGGDSRFGWHKTQTMTKPVSLGSDLGYQCDMSPPVNPMFITSSHYNPHSPASTCLSLTTSEGQLDMGDVSFEKTNKNKVLPREAVEVMTNWLREHQAHPYPNDDEKEMFLNRTKLTINQINYWFTNARRRLLPKWELKQRLEKEEFAKHDSGSNQSSAVS